MGRCHPTFDQLVLGRVSFVSTIYDHVAEVLSPDCWILSAWQRRPALVGPHGSGECCSVDDGLITIESDSQSADNVTGVVTAIGNVRIVYPTRGMVATSRQAQYFSREGRLVLSGDVDVVQDDGNSIRAERVTYDLNDEERWPCQAMVVRCVQPWSSAQQLGEDSSHAMSLSLNRVLTLGGRPLVKDLTLTLEPGEVIGLLGPNGAGKTTSFNLVIGLLDLIKVKC